MIQIDDAGSGSLVGGTCIGLYWAEHMQARLQYAIGAKDHGHLLG